jgi:hypothetical protein
LYFGSHSAHPLRDEILGAYLIATICR